MGRWEPDASGRLRQAAMELYIERGYEQTTVADIGERAALTARTFFRYFADKREVLFGGSELLQQALIDALDRAPAGDPPMRAIGAALDAAAEWLGQHRDYSRQRQSVIEANPELQERELMKMASLAVALAAGLRRRGVAEPEAILAAEAGVAVLRVSFERWLNETDDDLLRVMRDSLGQLRRLAVESQPG